MHTQHSCLVYVTYSINTNSYFSFLSLNICILGLTSLKQIYTLIVTWTHDWMLTAAIILVITDYVSFSWRLWHLELWSYLLYEATKDILYLCFWQKIRSIDPYLAFTVSVLWNSDHKRTYINLVLTVEY